MPILWRAANPVAHLSLNNRLRRALKWWRLLVVSCLAGLLTTSVLDAPKRGPLPSALTYTDASTDFGNGGVLLLPLERRAYFFRTPARGRSINYLKVEAAVVAEGVFGPRLKRLGYHEQISFLDKNVSLAWITDGCTFRDDVDPLIEDMWFRLACRRAFKWWERVVHQQRGRPAQQGATPRSVV